MDRTVQRLSKDFRFRQLPLDAAYLDFCGKEYDDGDWESVRVPHDWAANGLFAADNDASCMSIVQAHDGQMHAENLPQGGAKISFMLPIGGE